MKKNQQNVKLKTIDIKKKLATSLAKKQKEDLQ